jgi:hypothetical protein
MGIDFGKPMLVMFVMFCVSVPLGLWKLAEILWWLATHVKVSW